MEKECCTVKFTETDDGFRVDVTGKSLKEAMCCTPMFGMAGMKAGACCDTETKAGAECCPEDGKKG